jgi:hypothetical protein
MANVYPQWQHNADKSECITWDPDHVVGYFAESDDDDTVVELHSSNPPEWVSNTWKPHTETEYSAGVNTFRKYTPPPPARYSHHNNPPECFLDRIGTVHNSLINKLWIIIALLFDLK